MEVARLNVQNLVFRNLGLIAAGKSLSFAEASAMKLYSARAAVEVALEAVQVYGGNGYMSEYKVEQLCRDAKVLQIYAGTDDGLIQVSEDGGENWRRVDSLPGVPASSFINDVKADLHDADTVYAVLDHHKTGDFEPYLLKSTDRGHTWTSIAGDPEDGGLPSRHLVWRLVQDHENPALLFAGTEFGIFFTVDGGGKWIELTGGVPTISFRDLAIQKRENDLVGASFGRSIYVFDDYSPLRQVSEELLERDAVLFPVKDAWWYIEKRPLGRGDLNWLLAAACLVAPYEIFGLWYYGALLPNTYGAKLGGAVALGDKLRALAEQPLLVAFVAKQGFGFACLLALGLAGALLRGRKLAPVLWAPLFGASFFVLYAQSDWMPRYRLWIPALPFLCALVASGIVTIARRTGRSRFRRLVVWSACGVFLVQFALHESFDAYALGGPRTLGSQGKSIAWWSQVPAQLSQRTYPMEPLARSLLRLVPEGQTISAVSIGFIGFLTMNPIYDLGGLLTPLAARARFDDSPEVWDAFVAELLSTRPAHIYLVLRHGGLPFELEARLKDHPVIRRSYRRGFYDKPAGGSVAYLRRDLPPVDLEQRLADVLRYFPEYRERAMEMLRR